MGSVRSPANHSSNIIYIRFKSSVLFITYFWLSRLKHWVELCFSIVCEVGLGQVTCFGQWNPSPRFFFFSSFRNYSFFFLIFLFLKSQVEVCHIPHPTAVVKQSRILWGLPRTEPHPPCPLPAFCLQKNFSQRISLIREVRKMQKQRKAVTQDRIIIV